MKRYITWGGHASSEGGPILVADVKDYPQWTGSEQKWEEDSTYVVHTYGPLNATLPEKFAPQAKQWHQFIRISGKNATNEYVNLLCEAVKKQAPQAQIRKQESMDISQILSKARAAVKETMSPKSENSSSAMDSWLSSWRDHIEQGVDFTEGEERIFHFEVYPDQDYTRACNQLDEVEAVVVSFGKDQAQKALIWETEGPGVVQVGRYSDKKELILLRTWVTKEQNEREACEYVQRPQENEMEIGKISFSTGRLIIVWSPIVPSDLVAKGADIAKSLDATSALHPPIELNTTDILGVGTLLQIEPGEYKILVGQHETKKWSCRYARLKKLE